MRDDITDFPAGTGAGLGPGVLWQSGQELFQPLGLGLDDVDKFCLCGHGFSLRAVPPSRDVWHYIRLHTMAHEHGWVLVFTDFG